MIRNDYAILPVELLDQVAAGKLRERCEQLTRRGVLHDPADFFDVDFFQGQLQVGFDAGYLVTDDYVAGSAAPFAVYLALAGTSACFIVYRKVRMAEVEGNDKRRDVVIDIMKERRTLHQSLLAGETNLVQRVTPRLCDILTTVPSYAFSWFVFEDISQAQQRQWETEFKLLSEPAYVGMETDEWNTEEYRDDYHWQVPEIDSGVVDVDLDHWSCTYVTWSSIVAVTWGNPLQTARTKAMLLGLEIKLQTAWNKCYELSQHVDHVIADEGSGASPENILIGFTQAMESVRGNVSSIITSRYQAVFDKLRETSRIDDQIEALDRRLDLMERYIKRRQNQREEAYQRWITLILGLVAIAELLAGAAIIFTGQLSTTAALVLTGTGVGLALVLAALIFKWRAGLFRKRTAGKTARLRDRQ